MPGTVKSGLLPDADRSHKCDSQEKFVECLIYLLTFGHFITDEWQEGTVSGHKNDTGFVILPQGKTLDDYPERIVYMKDGERGYFEPINNMEPLGLFVVRFFIDSVCETIYRLQMNTGIYFFDIRQEDISGFIWRDILNTQMCREDEDKFMIEYKPHSYYEMAEVMCASNDSWYDNAKRNGDEKRHYGKE